MRKLIVPDARYRVTLGKAVLSLDEAYEVTVSDEGVITLTPVVTINPHALSTSTLAQILAETDA